MIFENRPISEIKPQELIDLIENKEEDLWIEYKKMEYQKDTNDLEKHKREICKDVTAMANAEGGYILIGVNEVNKLAQGFFPVPDAEKLAESINATCLQHIDPRIPNLKVEKYCLKWQKKDIALVIVHIPPSDSRPHSFKWKNSTNFVKRYGDMIKEFPVSELIQDLLIRYRPPFVDSMSGQISKIESQLASILRNTNRERIDSITSDDDPLNLDDDSELIHLMQLRFENDKSSLPYYRIYATPKELNSNAVSTKDQNIRAIMYNPPDRRYGNFGVTGILERGVSFTSEGIEGPNVTGGEIILLKNGYLEVRCPLTESNFQWRRSESHISTPWLYPYVVCEFPVTFLKLVKTVYEASGINSSVLIQQEYHNVQGFMLPRGNPSHYTFPVFSDETDVYNNSKPIITKQIIEADSNPDHVAYELVKEVYLSFGLEEHWIPAFDEEGNFTLE